MHSEENENRLLLTSVSLLLYKEVFDKPVEPGLAGMALKQILSQMIMMGWAVMNAAMLEANMNAVSRCLEYTRDVPQVLTCVHTCSPPLLL